MAEVNPRRLAQVNLSRVKHGERVFAATPETVLHVGDLIMAVGPADELDKMTLLLGERTEERMDVNAEVLSVDVELMDQSLTGKTLAQMRVWEQFTVVITRIRRQGLEIVPHARVTLEMGDGIRVVGEKSAVDSFVGRAQGSPRRAGAKMALTPDGKITGSVSGGCVEGAVYEAGVDVLKSKRPQLLHFGVADETAWEVGLACGGSIDMFVKPLDMEFFNASMSPPTRA